MNRNRSIHLAVIALVVGIFLVTSTPARAQSQAPTPPPATIAPTAQPVPPIVISLRDLRVLPMMPAGDLADLATLEALADVRGLTMARVDTDALEATLRAAFLDDQQAAKASVDQAKVAEAEAQVRTIERAMQAAQQKVREAASAQAKATAQATVDSTRAELQGARARLAAARAALDAARASWGDSNFERMDEQRAYEIGSAALDDSRWQRAVNAFDAVVKAKGKRADGGYYWKAYAQNRLGQRAEALATLQEIQKAYPASRWLNDAKALEVEVRQSMGQPIRPEGESDDDLKLLALRNVLASDPDRAIPAIEKMLQANNSPKVKDQALFVLAQSGSPRALEALARIAKGNGNPDLQLKAIRYLGVFGQSGRYVYMHDGGVTILNGARRTANGTTDPKVEEARRANAQMLADIYKATTNVDVKREVLRSFMRMGEKDRLLDLAKNEQSPELRAEAIRQLGSMGGQADLYKLYQVDLAAEVRRQIISAMVSSRSADQLLDIAKAETDSKLRALAIQDLGLLSSSGWRGPYALASPAPRAPQAKPPTAATPPPARTPPPPPAVAPPAQPTPPPPAGTPRALAPFVWAPGATPTTPVDTAKIGEGLVSIYKSDRDTDVRRAIIEALSRQQNAKALVDVARIETDPAMKKALVQRLSTMKAKEATDYMLELLK